MFLVLLEGGKKSTCGISDRLQKVYSLSFSKTLGMENDSLFSMKKAVFECWLEFLVSQMPLTNI